MTRPFALTEDQRATITNGLTLAADCYEENARTIRSLSPPHNIETLAEQFERQASDARAMVILIDGAEDIKITPYVEGAPDWTIPKRITLAQLSGDFSEEDR